MSLYENLQEKLNGQTYSNYFVCLCPFHDDHSPSFFVYEDGRYYCKSCRKSGTHEYLDKFLGGHGVKSTQKQSVVLPRWREWENKFGDLEGIARHANKSLKQFPQWNFYFRERKIERFVEPCMLGYIEGWVTFPVFSPEGKIENIVVRHTKNKARYAIKKIEEAKPLLYCPNWSRVANSDIVYVPYGVIDTFAFEAIGLASVTGIVGKSLSAELLRPLNKQIVLVPDEFEEQEAFRLANQLGWRARVKRLVFPDGTKDNDDIRRKFGNEYFAQMIGATT